MRRLLIFLILALVGGAIPTVRAQALFDSYSFDFGRINELDGVVEHTFTYKNEGKRPLVIISVAVSCGCTEPRYSIKPLAGGDSAKFTVRFDPTDRPGRFEKYVYIQTNVEKIQLEITGNVQGRPRTTQDDYPYLIASGVRLAALSVNVERANIGRPLIRQIGVVNSSLTLSAVVSIDRSSLPSWLEARVLSPMLGAGQQTEIEFTMQSPEFGLHHADVVMLINGVRQAERIWVEAIFTRDFTPLTPLERRDGGRIDFSSYYYHFSSRTLGEKLVRSFEIQNTGKGELVIDKIESSSPDIRFSIDRTQLASGEVAVLKIETHPGNLGVFNETVRVISNDAKTPVREVRIMVNVI